MPSAERSGPSLAVRTPEGVTLRAEIAGAGSRFGAALVDGALFGLSYAVLALSVFLIRMIDPTGLSRFTLAVLGGTLLLGFCAYQFLFHALAQGQTPGKRLFDLRVASADGYPAEIGQHVMRTLILPIDALLPVPAPFGILGLVVILYTERRQRLGDLVAGTLVLRERRAERASEPFPNESWSTLAQRTLPLVPAHAARLSSEDLSLLRDLWTRTGLNDDDRRRLFIAGARHYARKLELGEFADARVLLKELYLFLREARANVA
jgi:uncharacterized RDD family membrane protein YckC